MRRGFKVIILLLILETSLISFAGVGRLEVAMTSSQVMSKNIPATLILPTAYDNDLTREFPVVYLLHGAGATHSQWSDQTNIEELVDQHDIIAVCSDARKSWFFDSPLDPNYQYETYTTKELVEYVDNNYRTKASREFRAIAGLSMGGGTVRFFWQSATKTYLVSPAA